MEPKVVEFQREADDVEKTVSNAPAMPTQVDLIRRRRITVR